MPESFDAYQYLHHLRRRWRLTAAACATAVVLSLGVSLLTPKRYTATVRILIEPPGSADPRIATAISANYLASLKTYVHLASSDNLFKQAVEKWEVREPDDSGALSSLKKSILEVKIPRDTKVMEVSITLRDPEKAHALALYVAQQTVELSQSANVAGDQEQTAQIENLLAAARKRAEEADHQSMELARSSPAGGLPAELEALVEARFTVQQDVLLAEVRIAELAARQRRLETPADDERSKQLDEVRLSREDTEIRLKLRRSQLEDLDRQIVSKRLTLATRSAQHRSLESERTSAWAAVEAAQTRLAQARATVAARGERLQVIDPGVVPEQPSSPNIPLNLMAALLLGLVLSVLYLTLEFSYGQRKAESMRRSLRVASHG